MTEPAGDNARLNRTLGLPLVTLYGLGNILGAGIYALVGKVAGFVGFSTTLAFLIAMVTALSYMELAGGYPVSASVSVYLHRAFGKRWLSTALGQVPAVVMTSTSSSIGRCRKRRCRSWLSPLRSPPVKSPPRRPANRNRPGIGHVRPRPQARSIARSGRSAANRDVSAHAGAEHPGLLGAGIALSQMTGPLQAPSIDRLTMAASPHVLSKLF